jgi:hypothetical protein
LFSGNLLVNLNRRYGVVKRVGWLSVIEYIFRLIYYSKWQATSV